MNYQAKPFAAGIDQQGRYVTRQLSFEDSSGLCDTCPGELDSPEAVFQAEPEDTPWPELAWGLAVVLVALLSAHILVRL